MRLDYSDPLQYVPVPLVDWVITFKNKSLIRKCTFCGWLKIDSYGVMPENNYYHHVLMLWTQGTGTFSNYIFYCMMVYEDEVNMDME